MKKIIHLKSNQPLLIWALRILFVICVLLLIIIQMHNFLSRPKIKAQAINLRTEPNPKARIIKLIPRGERLQVIKKDHENQWWYVKAQKNKGWIASWLLNQRNYDAKKASNLSEATIVLDPGHGGSDSGTLSINGDMEKTYTLPLALKVYHLLKSQDAHVIITRTTDQSVSLGARTRLSNDHNADIFISFHFNSSAVAEGDSGYEVFKYHANADSLADQLDQHFNNLPLNNRGIDFGNYYVLRENTQPAVLIEMGFMNNPSDFKAIQSNTYKQKVADDVEQAFQKYLAPS